MVANALIVTSPDALAAAGRQADEFAAANSVVDYINRQSRQTIRRQAADLALFAQAINDTWPGLGKGVADLAAAIRECYKTPDCAELPSAAGLRGINRGIVSGFVEYMRLKGYAVGSINVRLATVKAYAGLAHAAGVITGDDYALIKTVKGFGRKQGKKVDEKRDKTRIERTGAKKAESTSLTRDQVKHLKQQPDTPQGRRDALLMCLLLDHGLRCGEVALLTVADFNLPAGTFSFYRPKVDKQQTHKMSADTLRAAAAYINQDVPALASKLLQGSINGGKLAGGMAERAINKRVRVLGEAAEIPHLSPHDCRHSWATRAARQGTDPFALQDAGGWNSLAMPRRYVEASKVANEGVKLED